MSRENEAIILSMDMILKCLCNTLPDEKVDKQEVKILEEKGDK